MLYLKPIINGIGNYYLEAQTRDARRTDVIVDYRGERFIVELKIWRGNEYNERGEAQLIDYLDYYYKDKGYMLSFNFNKKKKEVSDMYTTERFETTVPVSEYVKNYVDVDTFLECCKACPNYEKVWSCPPYDFDVLTYWNEYTTLELTAVKIVFDEEYAGKVFSQEELREIMAASLGKVKQALSEELFEREQKTPGSISLSAGPCLLCKGNCGRKENEPCRFPDRMRYSIESLGGNVGLTLNKLMGIELEWMEEGKLPRYFVLVCGLLRQGA